MSKHNILIQISLLIGLLAPISLNAQKKSIAEKGLLLISNSYDKFIDSIQLSDNFELVYVPDLFIPLKSDFTSAKKNDVIKIDGFCLFNLRNRQRLDSLSKSIKKDTANICHEAMAYKLLPIKIKYKILNNNKHALPCNDPITIKWSTSSIIFNYEYKEIDIKYIEIGGVKL